MSSQGGEFQQITEETQRIIEQIQNQLDSQAAGQPDGQPLQVAYQIIHDDDNQQVLEYHQVMEVDDSSVPTSGQLPQRQEGQLEQNEGTQIKDGQHILHVAMDPNHPNESSLSTEPSQSQVQFIADFKQSPNGHYNQLNASTSFFILDYAQLITF